MAPEVAAAQLDVVKPALDALGPYPILQFFAALTILVVVGIGGLAWLKGEKAAKAAANMVPLDAPRAPEAAVQLFFDGPLKAIFDCLHEIQTALAVSKLENKDSVAEMLSATRHGVIDAVTQSQAEIENSLEFSRRDTMGRVIALENEVRSITNAMIRIEANMMRRRQ